MNHLQSPPRVLAALALVLTAACSTSSPGGATDTDTPAATAAADLFGDGKFVPAEDVLAASREGAAIVFVDARTQLDYEYGHIPGAINVPYFEADQHLDKLPKDRWIVTYCECPHAEAEQVADVLLANGFSMVKVIDEGLAGWREQGGEVQGGAPSEG
jgi:rhodanese-related sulfurtransferase